MPEIYEFMLDIDNWGLKVPTLIKVNLSGKYPDHRVQGKKNSEFIIGLKILKCRCRLATGLTIKLTR